VTWSGIAPKHGIVDVWAVPAGGSARDDVALLSDDERARMLRLPRDARSEFARSHAALRRVVAVYTGAPPDAATVSACYGAAPRADGLELSLSHCDEVAVVAVACAPVGIDIESVAAGEDQNHVADLAEMTLAPRELARFQAQEVSARPEAWVRSFARKEA
jgi:4'-phosphopantetheinyl transferase